MCGVIGSSILPAILPSRGPPASHPASHAALLSDCVGLTPHIRADGGVVVAGRGSDTPSGHFCFSVLAIAEIASNGFKLAMSLRRNGSGMAWKHLKLYFPHVWRFKTGWGHV